MYCCLYCLCKGLSSVYTLSTRTKSFSSSSFMHRDGGWAVCSWRASSEAVQLREEALGSPDELAARHHVPVLWHFGAGGHRGSRDQRAASGHGQDDALLSCLHWRSVCLSLQGCAGILRMGIDHWPGNLNPALHNDPLGAGPFTPWDTSKRSQKDQSWPSLHCPGHDPTLQSRSWLSCLLRQQMLWK